MLPGADTGAGKDAAGPGIDGGVAGSCSPGDVSQFTPSWKPPVGPHTGDCNDAQLDAVIASCFDPGTSSQKNCNAWFADPTNAGCGKCWAGPVTASKWAPFVYAQNPGESNYVNVSGCIALSEPTELQCAQSFQAAFTCGMAACLANCPVPQTGDTAKALQDLRACYVTADANGCQTFATLVDKCGAPLVDAGAASFCFAAETDNTALRQLFSLACGPAPTDAGLDAGATD